MIDSLYYSSRGENSFVDYKIDYKKLCYSLQKIWTWDLNRPNVYLPLLTV